MHPILRLYEDSISGGVAPVHLPALPRMIFVVHGSADIGGKTLIDGETWNGEGVAVDYARQGRRDAAGASS